MQGRILWAQDESGRANELRNKQRNEYLSWGDQKNRSSDSAWLIRVNERASEWARWRAKKISTAQSFCCCLLLLIALLYHNWKHVCANTTNSALFFMHPPKRFLNILFYPKSLVRFSPKLKFQLRGTLGACILEYRQIVGDILWEARMPWKMLFSGIQALHFIFPMGDQAIRFPYT